MQMTQISLRNTYLASTKEIAKESNVDMRVYYTPILITIITGIIYHFNFAVHNLHIVIDILRITRERSMVLGIEYSKFLKKKQSTTTTNTLNLDNPTVKYLTK